MVLRTVGEEDWQDCLLGVWHWKGRALFGVGSQLQVEGKVQNFQSLLHIPAQWHITCPDA